MERGGFDAMIGNPPFLGGQKIYRRDGHERSRLVRQRPRRRQRRAAPIWSPTSSCARASLLDTQGNLGLIATNTVAQGDTREVGLDRMVADGFTITRSIQSRSWPAASVNLEYAAVWGSSRTVADQVPRVADGVPVARISTLLEPAGRSRALQSAGRERGHCFHGLHRARHGFRARPDEARDWIGADPQQREVLFPT